MSRLLTISIAMLVSAVGTVGDKCDNKTLEKAPWCKWCDQIEPDVDEKKACKECSEIPEAVAVCVKTVYQCARCEKQSRKNREHCKGAETTKVTKKARILFLCENCGSPGDRDGDLCDEDGCRDAAKKIRRTCSDSGTWPHGGRAKGK